MGELENLVGFSWRGTRSCRSSFTFCASVSLFCNSLECNSVGDFFFETLVILSAILLPIKLPVASAVF